MDTKQKWKRLTIKITLAVLGLAVLFAGLNFQQLYSVWTVSNETRQLERRAAYAPQDVENPEAIAENFEEGLSTEFWDFTIINGAGQASNETAWHAAEMVIDHQLNLRHTQDPAPKQIQTTDERVKLVYRIKIDVENPNQELKANMPVDAEIVL